MDDLAWLSSTRTRRTAYWLAHRYLGDGAPSDADDVVQAALLALLEGLANGKPVRPRLRWAIINAAHSVKGVRRNPARATYSRPALVSLDDLPELEAAAPLPEVEVAGHVWIHDFLDLCSPREAYVAWRLSQGTSQTEIASELGVSKQRVGHLVASLRRRAEGEVRSARSLSRT